MAKTKPDRPASIAVNVPPKVKAFFEQYAAIRLTTVSNIIRPILVDFFEEAKKGDAK